ncbi:DJ-1/PfpI family protein [Pyramidobacter piscolens]|uniref:DJ-1/PfpI family protein n=1 Tax=Pyramidobacter piscolens TaxID=638849 RepID=UPI0024924B4C|nr:DJ-1/PfpI family protein [Pyramidobacter piscolens]
MKKICMYLCEAMADWEHGYALQGLSLQKMLPEKKYELLTVSNSKNPVHTAGGLTVVPDAALKEIDENSVSALLLIGGDAWLKEEQKEALDLAVALIEKNAVVAAICGATLGLAERGILNDRAHTSNAPSFLSGLTKNYDGLAHYRHVPAVCDGNLITASAAGSLLWARYIIERLDLYSPATVSAWHNYFLTGEPEFFAALMKSFER